MTTNVFIAVQNRLVAEYHPTGVSLRLLAMIHAMADCNATSDSTSRSMTRAFSRRASRKS
jgi:hypothetical protein